MILAFGLAAHGEYRVFKLKITKTAPPAAPGEKPSEPESRELLSNLDPDQYRGFYPVAADETVSYTETWRCRGRTDGKEYCENPRSPASVQGPESAPSK